MKVPVKKKTEDKVKKSIKQLNAPNLTPEETEALEDMLQETEPSEVPIDRLNKVVEFVFNCFNLQDKDYQIDSYAEKNGKVKLSVSNPQYTVAVTINDREEHPELMY